MSNATHIGRNDPCPCGSGKKYKKCCLPTGKYEQLKAAQASATAVAAAADAALAAEALEKQEWPVKIPTEEVVQEEESETEEGMELGEGWLEEESADTGAPGDATANAELERTCQEVDKTFPEPTAEEHLFVEAWWKETKPLYRKLEKHAQALCQRVHASMDQHPAIFPHLHLEDELLFELGAELTRQDQRNRYSELLERLRREQRRTYEQIFHFLDLDMVEDCIIQGRRQDISRYLDLFIKYPAAGPEECHRLVVFLAWNNAADALRELVSACARPWHVSQEIVGGQFGFNWLSFFQLMRALDARDDSDEASRKLCQALMALNQPLSATFEPAELKATLHQILHSDQPPDLKSHRLGSHTYRVHLGNSFCGFLHDHKGLGWIPAWLLVNQLEDYWSWRGHKEGRARSLFRLNRQEMEHYLAKACLGIFYLDGPCVLSTLQSLVFFADYLGAQNAFSAAEVERVKADCATLFELGRKGIDGADPAYRLYPTFAALCAAEPAKR